MRTHTGEKPYKCDVREKSHSMLYWGNAELKLKLTCWDVSFCWSVSNVLPSDKLLWLDMLRCEQIWWACWDTSWNVLQFSSTFYVNHKSHLNMKNKQITTANTFLPIQWKVPPGCLTVWTWSRSKQHSCLRNFFLKNSLSPEFFIYCQA